ncbi:hypothetical protein C8J56DRAFT_897115 [Mycena floridula]|nr:hypothetical protein C8J56DRAFT_897115 [Mycena floridula]
MTIETPLAAQLDAGALIRSGLRAPWLSRVLLSAATQVLCMKAVGYSDPDLILDPIVGQNWNEEGILKDDVTGTLDQRNYEAHLWARLLGASDFVGTAIKVPNGDIHSPNQKYHLCIHPAYKPWCKWPFSPSSIPRYSGCSIAIPQGLLFASSLMDEEKNIKGKIQKTYIEKNHFTLSVATSMRFIAACICIGQPVIVITRYYSLGNVAWALGYPALVTDIMFIMSAGLLDICRRRISSK